MAPFPTLSLLDFDGFRITDVTDEKFQQWFTPQVMKKEGRPLVVVQVISSEPETYLETVHREVAVLSHHQATSRRMERQIRDRLWKKFCYESHSVSFTWVFGVKTYRDDVHRDLEGVWEVLEKISK